MCMYIFLYVYVCLRMYLCMCTCVFTYFYVYVCLRMYLFMCTCVYMFLYVYVCLRMYLCMCTCVYMFLYVYVCLRMYLWGGVQTHFCPSPNPDFDVSWAKMGKNEEKSIWKETEKVFVLTHCWHIIIIFFFILSLIFRVTFCMTRL